MMLLHGRVDEAERGGGVGEAGRGGQGTNVHGAQNVRLFTMGFQ